MIERTEIERACPLRPLRGRHTPQLPGAGLQRPRLFTRFRRVASLARCGPHAAHRARPLWLDVLHATSTDSHYKPMFRGTRRAPPISVCCAQPHWRAAPLAGHHASSSPVASTIGRLPSLTSSSASGRLASSAGRASIVASAPSSSPLCGQPARPPPTGTSHSRAVHVRSHRRKHRCASLPPRLGCSTEQVCRHRRVQRSSHSQGTSNGRACEQSTPV